MLALLLQSTSLLPDALATTLVLLASLINGFGGALLWSAQGSLVILESSGGDGGRQSGDFWALFQVSAIVGNLWAFFSFSAGAQPTALFAVFFGIALLGCACFVCVRPSPLALVEAAIADTSAVGWCGQSGRCGRDAATPSARTAAAPPPPSTPQPSSSSSRIAAGGGGGGERRRGRCSWALSEAIEMWSTIWSARALMPLLFLGGFLMAYQFGVFPLVMRRADVGLCFVIFGIAEVLGAWLCGRWVGSLGASRYRLLTMIVTTLSLILALPIALTAPHPRLPIRQHHPRTTLLHNKKSSCGA